MDFLPHKDGTVGVRSKKLQPKNKSVKYKSVGSGEEGSVKDHERNSSSDEEIVPVTYNITKRNRKSMTIQASRCRREERDYVFYDLNGREVERCAKTEVREIRKWRPRRS